MKPLQCEQRFSIMQMNAATKERRMQRAGELAKRFSHKRSIERCVWQDEKDFTLQVPLNHQNDRVYGACEKKDLCETDFSSSKQAVNKGVWCRLV